MVHLVVLAISVTVVLTKHKVQTKLLPILLFYQRKLYCIKNRPSLEKKKKTRLNFINRNLYNFLSKGKKIGRITYSRKEQNHFSWNKYSFK